MSVKINKLIQLYLDSNKLLFKTNVIQNEMDS